MVPTRVLAIFAVLTSVTLADEPVEPVQSYGAPQRPPAYAPPAIPSYPSYPTGAQAYVPAGYTTSRPVEDESTRMLKENPTLVRQLLQHAVEEGEEAVTTIYCLGPAATKPLLAEFDSDDPELREAAMSALTVVCAHDDAPRTEIVKVILAKMENADTEQSATLREVLNFVVRSMRPEFRATLRTAIDAGLSDDL